MLISKWVALLLAAAVVQAAPVVKVAVAMPPYQGIAQALGGERVAVVSMVPAGSNPHVWEPTPASLKELGQSALYFTDSAGMDLPWLARFRAVNSRLTFVNIAADASWMKDEHEHHHEDGDDHPAHEKVHVHEGHDHDHDHHDHDKKEEHAEAEALDPHIWTSPAQVRLMAVRIAAALMAEDPAGVEYYKVRLADFLTRVYALDHALRAKVQSLPQEQRRFLIFHPSYGYLARDYGLVQMSVEVEGKEPKPADMARLVDVARKNQIRTVLVQPEFSKRSAETLAREIGGRVVATDPLSADWEGNLRAFMNGLGQE